MPGLAAGMPPPPPPPPPPPTGATGMALIPIPAVSQSIPSRLTLWAQHEFEVNGDDLTGITLTLQPGMVVSGRITFEGTSLKPPASLAGLRVTLSMGGGRLLFGAPPEGMVLGEPSRGRLAPLYFGAALLVLLGLTLPRTLESLLNRILAVTAVP